MISAGKVTAAIAKSFAESEYEKYRIKQDRLYISDFDKLIEESEKGKWCNQLLEKIKERPGIYFGKPSITRLNIFLQGYNFARAEEENPHRIDLRDFQVFIAAIYNEKRSIGWADIILEDYIDEEVAFWKFYEYYEEFEKGQKTVERFVKQYVDDSIFGDNKLIWNSLKHKVSEKIVTFSNREGVENVRKLVPKELFLYDERQKLLQKVTIGKILGMLSSLEVWEEKDLYVFDVSMEWFIAFTHEDMVLVYGI